MGLLLESFLLELVLVLAGGLAAVCLWFWHRYGYWRRKGVRYLQPSIPFGNFRNSVLGYKSIGEDLRDLYQQAKGSDEGLRFVGLFGFTRPQLMVLDPDLLRQVLVKDHAVFHDRGIYTNEDEPLARHLFTLNAQPWRRLRAKLTPTFTSGKLKHMFQTLQDCGEQLVAALEQAAEGGEAVEMRELSARFTTDIIASVAFGILANSLTDPASEFRDWGRQVFMPSARIHVSTLMMFLCPRLAAALKIPGGMEDISKHFRKMVYDTVKFRETRNVTRNDFLQLLIELKNKGFLGDEKSKANGAGDLDDWKLSMEDLAANVYVFFIAGFETSSTTTSFALLELAAHPQVQARLADEIRSALKASGGQVTYDLVQGLHYLDRVVAETLRKYPPLPLLSRESNQRYSVPGSSLELEAGSAVVVPVMGLHYDPDYYPDPHRFDPDRFTEQAKATRPPYVYLPFGEGPRNCIGMRFGLLQTKLGLVNILSRFSIHPAAETQIPPPLHPRAFILMAGSGVHLKLTKRPDTL